MPAIEEHIQVVVERYNYSNHSWDRVAELGDGHVISATTKKQCCADGAYEIGGVYAATINIVCKVPGMTYFQMKSCRFKVKHWFGSGTPDPSNIGVFYVSDVQKTGELFSISGQDVIGFTDISSKCGKKGEHGNITSEWSCSSSLLSGIGKPGLTINGVGNDEGIISIILHNAGDYVETKTGIVWAFKFKPYSADENFGWQYANARVAQWDQNRLDDHGLRLPYDLGEDASGNYRTAQHPDFNAGQDEDYKVKDAIFGIYADDFETEAHPSKFYGNARSDKPRDFLRYAATVAAGFIYADYGSAAGLNDTDYVTLGQFGEPRWGYNNGETDTTVEITMQEIELGSSEVADFTIQYVRSTLSAELKPLSRWSWKYEPSQDYQNHAYIRIELTDNPFTDFYLWNWCQYDGANNKGALFELVNVGIWEPVKTYAGGYTIRPFHATVHKPVDFHLGQRIRFRDYKGCGETVAHTYDSILTSIQWTFRGGYKLACGGEDERTMGDMIRASKGDKVRRQLRDDLDALHAIYL